MSPFGFALRSLTRQPARALLGIAGITLVGALLFDMLLLSRGLMLSFGDLLEGIGYDVRVTATSTLPPNGPQMEQASTIASELTELPEIDGLLVLRFERAYVIPDDDARWQTIQIIGSRHGEGNYWRLVEGQGLRGPGSRDGDDSIPSLLINPYVAEELGVGRDDLLTLTGRCGTANNALPPVRFRISGVADFPFDAARQLTAAAELDELRRLCGERENDRADLLLASSHPQHGPDAAVAAILDRRPDLHAFSNDQLLLRFERTDFSYFRQISFVLAAITVFFAFLLIAALLTVSVNQRFVEVAALRALGFSRRRVAVDLLWESTLLVGFGGLLALPVGGGFAYWLDGILRAMPGLPADLHFFVFQPSAVGIHIGLLALTGLLASVYPVFLAARLPIAATLRREVVS